MNRIGHVVIGANFGDEGKGLLTDFIAARDPDHSLVVRFNGGAQAGHTVITPDGRRHVFSHFGSGTLAGCSTYLSRFFIVNPLLFIKEWRQLAELKAHPQIAIDAQCMVTTPFDVFINQLKEMQRGSDRHGSCGAGINETVTRCWRAPDLMTRAGEFSDLKTLREKLMKLADSWLPARISELNLGQQAKSSPDAVAFLKSIPGIVDQYLNDVRRMLRYATICTQYPSASEHSTIIFEGAQGLLLDEDRIDGYPHLTRSKTGLFNVLYLAPRMGLEQLDVTYMTRTYLTRHGAGPLNEERSDWAFPDHTNVTNKFQGSLRFAPLSVEDLNHSIKLDLASARRSSRLDINAGIGITWADQMQLPDENSFCLPIRYISFGPTRSDVRTIHDLKNITPVSVATGDRKSGAAVSAVMHR